MSTYGAAKGLFSNWSARADLEDAFSVAIDQATIALLRMHVPAMAARYIDDDLPEQFERLLDRASVQADTIAGGPDGAAYIDAYRTALAMLLSPFKVAR